MTPQDAYKQWLPDTLCPTHEESFEAGWRAAMAHIDPKRPWSDSPIHEELAAAGLTGSIVTAEDIYNAWPVKKARGAAIPAIQRAIKKAGADTVMKAVKDFAAAFRTWRPEDRQYCCMCSTFMNQERWLDDRSTWKREVATTQQIRSQN